MAVKNRSVLKPVIMNVAVFQVCKPTRIHGWGTTKVRISVVRRKVMIVAWQYKTLLFLRSMNSGKTLTGWMIFL
jgi:hypothetical protein